MENKGWLTGYAWAFHGWLVARGQPGRCSHGRLYDVMPALTMWWEGGQQRRRPHFVDDVPAEDDNDHLMNGVRYIWECRLIIRELVYDDEILIRKCTLLIIWYQIWFSSAWSASGNAFRATDNVDIYLLWPHVEIMISPWCCGPIEQLNSKNLLKTWVNRSDW